MALTYNKFNTFVGDLAGKLHDLVGAGGSTADQVFCMLSNTAPSAANAVKADITQIASGNGYTTDGADTANSGSAASGTFTLTGTNITWTAGPAAMGAFQYIVAYNKTQTVPAGPLIAWWDRGAALTLQNGETYTIKFNGGASSGTIFTLA